MLLSCISFRFSFIPFPRDQETPLEIPRRACQQHRRWDYPCPSRFHTSRCQNESMASCNNFLVSSILVVNHTKRYCMKSVGYHSIAFFVKRNQSWRVVFHPQPNALFHEHWGKESHSTLVGRLGLVSQQAILAILVSLRLVSAWMTQEIQLLMVVQSDNYKTADDSSIHGIETTRPALP